MPRLLFSTVVIARLSHMDKVVVAKIGTGGLNRMVVEEIG